MKIIIDTDTLTDNITAITASSEDASFPVSNLQDDFTTNLFKAASGTSVTLTFSVSKGSALAIINTNATSATATAGIGGSYDLESGYSLEAGYSLEDSESGVTLVYDLPGTNGRLWVDYSEYTGPHIVTVVLTTASAVPSAGIARGGDVQSFRDPAYGLNEGSIDFSVEKELNNGADYYRKRNVVRTFGNLFTIETRTNCYLFKHGIFDAVGPKPLAIRLVHNANITDDEFVIFAKQVDPPEITHNVNRTYSRLDFSLREVV